jgi:hypothetical protein
VSGSVSSQEETILKKIARQYSSEGYDVVIAPTASELPEPLKSFEIDLLARREGDTVIVEVKRSTSKTPDPNLQALAEAVSRMPNHRFDFVAVAKEAVPNPSDWFTKEELVARLNESVRLKDMGFPEASTLLLWSTTEGTLRLLAAQEHISAKVQNPSALIKNLYSRGVVDKNQYNVLEQAVRYRNAAAHAYRTEVIEDAFFERWSALTADLLKGIRSGRHSTSNRI